MRTPNYQPSRPTKGAIWSLVASGFVLSLVLVAGCAELSQYGLVPLYMRGVTNIDHAHSFDADSARKLISTGPHKLVGTAFLKLASGVKAPCAEADVALVPATAYASERMQALFGDTQAGSRVSTEVLRFRPNVAEYAELQRSAKCDATGQFVFTSVEAGDFFVVAAVDVSIGNVFSGGLVMRRVQVAQDTSVAIEE